MVTPASIPPGIAMITRIHLGFVDRNSFADTRKTIKTKKKETVAGSQKKAILKADCPEKQVVLSRSPVALL
jgi:hypothetical protein